MCATHLCGPLTSQLPPSTALACRDQTRALAEISPAGLCCFHGGAEPWCRASGTFLLLVTIPFLFPASFLESRSWRGLEQQLGQTPVSKAVQGRRGIAIAYEDEGCEQP